MSDRLGPLSFGKRDELVFLGREIGEQRNYSDDVAKHDRRGGPGDHRPGLRAGDRGPHDPPRPARPPGREADRRGDRRLSRSSRSCSTTCRRSRRAARASRGSSPPAPTAAPRPARRRRRPTRRPSRPDAATPHTRHHAKGGPPGPPFVRVRALSRRPGDAARYDRPNAATVAARRRPSAGDPMTDTSAAPDAMPIDPAVEAALRGVARGARRGAARVRADPQRLARCPSTPATCATRRRVDRRPAARPRRDRGRGRSDTALHPIVFGRIHEAAGRADRRSSTATTTSSRSTRIELWETAPWEPFLRDGRFVGPRRGRRQGPARDAPGGARGAARRRPDARR